MNYAKEIVKARAQKDYFRCLMLLLAWNESKRNEQLRLR